MTQQQLINKTADFVKQKFSTEPTGHDWWHMYRVWQLAKQINLDEKTADPLVVELAALLHDIADWKFHDGDMEAGPRAAREWLESLHASEDKILHIEDIIRNTSFKGSGVASTLKTIEGKIIHDADKLDAIGAIGIARAFAYGGSKSRNMHDPELVPTIHKSFEEYKNARGTTINHFHEKLLLLKDRMYTTTGQKIAQHRHEYMQKFLDEFHNEWSGKV